MQVKPQRRRERRDYAELKYKVSERVMAMIMVHRGAGMLAPGFGLLFALFMNVLTFRVFGGEYYQEHRWPKLTVLIMSGIACLQTSSPFTALEIT